MAGSRGNRSGLLGLARRVPWVKLRGALGASAGLVACLGASSCATEDTERQQAPGGCEGVEQAIEGRWKFVDRGTVYESFLRSNVSPHPDRLEFEDGEFTAEYSKVQLEMLRRMMEDASVSPVLRGRYEIVGRKARDLYLIPCSIQMGPGFPEVRSISMSDGRLELGNVGDTWSVEVYRREE